MSGPQEWLQIWEFDSDLRIFELLLATNHNRCFAKWCVKRVCSTSKTLQELEQDATQEDPQGSDEETEAGSSKQ